ncbi:rhomboid family intramembrane serine protease [Streptomyces sp. NPDC101227]|uniref:rhomboid family intramembrane serine protease n=1 Tax=Streptomyces sp. NPDC101227 TaxID=3366136 RepID=UPI0038126520
MDQVPGSPQEPKDAHGGDGLPACYRHPDRTTGIHCTRCDKPICPDCMVSASVGFHCPDCVRGGGTGHSASATAPRTIAGGIIAANPRLITLILMGINLAVFIAVLIADKEDGSNQLLSDLVMRGRTPSGYLPQGVANGEWYRLVTAMFLHQEIPHIAFNMLSLWWLGPPLEAALGRLRFFVLYMLAGLGGSALSYLIAPPDAASLGASGAIFGLLGATAVLMRRLNYDMKPVLILLGLNLVFTFAWPNISWQAHIGGLVVGAAVAYGMVHAPRERRNLVHTATCVVALLAIVAVVWVRTLQLVG